MRSNLPISRAARSELAIGPLDDQAQATCQTSSGASGAPSSPPMLMTLEQAAALLHFAPNTIRRFAVAGQVPATKVGKCWRFHRDLLCDWLKAQSLENVRPCPSVVAKAPRIGKFAFSSLDARLEAQLAQPTAERPSGSRRSFVVAIGDRSNSGRNSTPGTTL